MSMLLLDKPVQKFTPTMISGCKLWLRAARITGLVDGDPVGTWADLSGNANDATQATAAKKPTYKTAIVNGRPVVRFDGVDDALACATHLTDATSTVFVIASGGSGTGWRTLFAPQKYEWDKRSASNDLWGLWVATAGMANSSYALGSTFRNLSIRIRAFNDFDLITDGIKETNTPAGTAAARSTTYVGALSGGSSQFHDGDIAELVYYNSALSAADHNRLGRYLAREYNLTWTTVT